MRAELQNEAEFSCNLADREASAALRDRLTAELEDLNSAEEAANWAHRALGAKNTLIAADAARVEEDFQARLKGIATSSAPGRNKLSGL